METISMSASDRKRLLAMSRLESGEWTLARVSEVLQLSYRQSRRIWRRYQEQGAQGLVHQGRGRRSNRGTDEELRSQCLALYGERYGDYGPTLAAEVLAEVLAEEHSLKVSVTTLRRWLMAADLWDEQRPKRRRRRLRARRSCWGELVQMDGSHHDWFEGRRTGFCTRDAYAGWAVLMVMIDDATSWTYARFYENESWESAADVFRRYVDYYGLPAGLYVDRAAIYRADREPTDEEILNNTPVETQFGRAMRELGVGLTLAHSAQAKGRVERMNGTLQDRLVKALRRRDISDLESANAYLEEEFLDALNERFSKDAGSDENWHTELSPAVDLGRILSIQEARVVGNDWTVRWKNQRFQLDGATAGAVRPKDRIVVCEQLDGALRMFHGDTELSFSTAASGSSSSASSSAAGATGRSKRSADSRSGPTGSSQGNKPSPDHIWRRGFAAG